MFPIATVVCTESGRSTTKILRLPTGGWGDGPARACRGGGGARGGEPLFELRHQLGGTDIARDAKNRSRRIEAVAMPRGERIGRERVDRFRSRRHDRGRMTAEDGPGEALIGEKARRRALLPELHLHALL